MQAITKVFSDIVKPYIDEADENLQNQVNDIVNVLSAKNLWSETITPDIHEGGSYTLANNEYVVSTAARAQSGIYWSPDKLSTYYADMVGVSVKISFEIKADAAMSAYAGFYNNEVNLTTNYQTIEQDIADLSQIASTLKVYTLDAVAHTIFMKNVMIRLASITDYAYVPYAKTNQQLTKDDIGLTANEFANGAVNLLENKATSQTINGVTFTVNSDGTVTANGTATANAILNVNSAYKLGKVGNYILSGVPTNGSTSSFFMRAFIRSDPTTIISNVVDVGKGVEFSNKYNIDVQIIVLEGQTVSNLVFKPMITVADMPNSDYDHYVPYAMTNREITEKLDYRSLGSQSYTATAANSWEYTGLSFTLDKPALVNIRGLNINSSVNAISVGTSPTVQSSAAYQFVDSSAARIQQTVFLPAGTYYVWAKFAGANQNTISANKLLEFPS